MAALGKDFEAKMILGGYPPLKKDKDPKDNSQDNKKDDSKNVSKRDTEDKGTVWIRYIENGK